MAYNASLYNPYGVQQFQPMLASVQPVNELTSVKSSEGAMMYPLPPNSVSKPLFLEDENAFFIKTTDGGGAATLKKYTFEEAVIEPESNSDYVTKEYLDSRISQIMEAINGKHIVSKQSETAKPSNASNQPDSIIGAVQYDFQSDVQE